MRLEGVAVLGVGMCRFGVHKDATLTELGREAGFKALEDAGISFRDVGEAFVGYMQAMPMTGIKMMKEFGLSGLPITHVENASATGLVAFREAAHAVEQALTMATSSTAATTGPPESLRTLAEIELEYIKSVLRSCGNNQARAARVLGIGRNTLWRKLKKSGDSAPGDSVD